MGGMAYAVRLSPSSAFSLQVIPIETVPFKYLSTRFSFVIALGPGLDMLLLSTITE